MARKKQPLYTADELREFKRVIEVEVYGATLHITGAVVAFRDDATFDRAIAIRDIGQMLATSLHTINKLDKTIELAELDKAPQSFEFDIDGMGLDPTEPRT